MNESLLYLEVMSLRGARGCDDEDERCGIRDGRGEAIIMVNGTQVVAGCGRVGRSRCQTHAFESSSSLAPESFQELPGFIKPHTEC